ncbi:MAG: HpcH/HpaI aldolase/citrate lyase family protein [Methylovulum sp.]
MTMQHPALPEPFSPWFLGAPLYMPAHRRDLMECANGEKLQALRSMIFCTEDAVSHRDVNSSLRHLGLCLQGFRQIPGKYRFIRARNPDILARLLELTDIEKIDGFVLPKFNQANFYPYLDQLKGTAFKIMPTLETREVFDCGAMSELRQALLQDDILPGIAMLRIGGNDLMNLLGIRRPRGMTLYETPMGNVISQLATVFKPYGFSLSAPVFEYLNDAVTLQREIQLDMAHGLTGKTAIHPAQIPTIEAAYAVDIEDYQMAVSLCDEEAPAVFKMHNAMCEVATHQRWAAGIISRQRCYGVKMQALLDDYAELSV